MTSTIPLPEESIPTTTTTDETDNTSLDGSTCSSSSRAEERRRRRETWRREHENQLKVDGTFPRRSTTSLLGGQERNAVSAKVVQHLGTKTTASLHTLPPAVSDSVRVRSNLLRTLGIQKSVVADDSKTGIQEGGGKGSRHRRIQSADGRSLLLQGGGDLPSKPVREPPNRPLLSNVRMSEELKYDSDEDTTLTKQNNNYARFFGLNKSNNSNTPNNDKSLQQIPRRPRLIFSNQVVIVPIPMRSEYSNRIKERMYSNRVELSENAQRNVVEFEAEGWDAATVLDDEEQFYKCPLTGELIHPVHLSYFKGGEGGDEGR